MLTHLAAQIVVAAGGINTNGITDFIAKNIVPIILCIVGVLIMASAKKGRISEGANTLTICLIGAIPIVAGAAFMAFGNNIANVIFN